MASADQERARPLPYDGRKRCVEVAAFCRPARPLTCTPISRAAASCTSRIGVNRRIVRADKHRDGRSFWNQFVKQLQPLRLKLALKRLTPGQVAAGPTEARDKAKLHRIVADMKTIGMVVVACLAAACHACGRSKHRHRAARPVRRQIAGNRSDRLLASDPRPRRSGLRRSPLLSSHGGTPQSAGASCRASTANQADHRHRRLLRARRKRPRRRATQNTEKFPPPHVRPWLRRRHRIGSNECFDRG